MSTTNMVRSAMDGHRRNSKVADYRRNSGFGSSLLGASGSDQSKSVSDDEEEDDCNLDDAVDARGNSPIRDRKRSELDLESRTTTRDTGGDVGTLRHALRKSSLVRKEGGEGCPPVSPPSSPSSENVSNDEDLDLYDDYNIPWYLKVLSHVMRCSIDPDGLLYFYWKAILTLAVMYNYVVIILRIAFDELRIEAMFSTLDLVCDFIYIVDIFVETKVCYLSNGSLITDSGLTLQNYLGKKGIVLDVMAVFPLRIFIITTAGLCNIFGCPISLLEHHYSVIEPTFRLNKLAKTHVMNSFFYKTESRTNSPNLLRAVRLGIQLALVIHWMACLYYMISMYEGLGSSEWAYPSDPEYKDFQRKYIVCMYWSIMTLTTIGERPSPVTSLEYIFTGLTFLIGVFVFAAVVGNVGDVISNMNAARRDFQTRMDQIKFYINHRQVPEVLQTRIKRWAEYTWDRTKAVDEPSVLQWLPERLRTEVAIYVHLSVLKKVSIFDECEEGLLRELVLKLKPQIYSPGDYICRIGEIGREMYIINHGQVEILFPDAETGAMRQVAVMNPGNFFGEISLLKLDDGQNKRTADVRSIGFSELLCLSRRDLMVALTEYPDAKRILEEYARERFQQTKKHSQSRGGSSSNSPRESVTSATNSPMSARQAFARVMRKEGFANLLKRKDTDLMAIKSAVEELKATSSTEVHQTFVSLHKEIQDMGRQLLQKDIQMQRALDEIAYLKSIISQRFNSPSHLHNGHTEGPIPKHGEDDDTKFPSSFDTNGVSGPGHGVSPRSPSETQRFRNQFYSNGDGEHSPSPPLIPLDTDNDERDNYYKISFMGSSQDVLETASESKDSIKNVENVDSSFNSSDGDSDDEDLELIEAKFDQIGKGDLYVSSVNKRSVSLNMLSELTNNSYQNNSQPNPDRRRKASFELNSCASDSCMNKMGKKGDL